MGNWTEITWNHEVHATNTREDLLDPQYLLLLTVRGNHPRFLEHRYKDGRELESKWSRISQVVAGQWLLGM